MDCSLTDEKWASRAIHEAQKSPLANATPTTIPTVQRPMAIYSRYHATIHPTRFLLQIRPLFP